MNFQPIFETRKCRVKTIFEWRDLIENSCGNESFEHFRKIEDSKALNTKKIYIPIHFRDLPLNFVLETERLRSLVRRLKFKTLGDFHDLEFTQIKNTKHVGDKTFSEFQELIEQPLIFFRRTGNGQSRSRKKYGAFDQVLVLGSRSARRRKSERHEQD